MSIRKLLWKILNWLNPITPTYTLEDEVREYFAEEILLEQIFYDRQNSPMILWRRFVIWTLPPATPPRPDRERETI